MLHLPGRYPASAGPLPRKCLLAVHAVKSYSAGMQYTIRGIPEEVDRVLRAKARAEGKSLNAVALDVFCQGLGLAGPRVQRRDLSDVFGKSPPDLELDKALAECRQIDWEEWK